MIEAKERGAYPAHVALEVSLVGSGSQRTRGRVGGPNVYVRQFFSGGPTLERSPGDPQDPEQAAGGFVVEIQAGQCGVVPKEIQELSDSEPHLILRGASGRVGGVFFPRPGGAARSRPRLSYAFAKSPPKPAIPQQEAQPIRRGGFERPSVLGIVANAVAADDEVEPGFRNLPRLLKNSFALSLQRLNQGLKTTLS